MVSVATTDGGGQDECGHRQQGSNPSFPRMTPLCAADEVRSSVFVNVRGLPVLHVVWRGIWCVTLGAVGTGQSDQGKVAACCFSLSLRALCRETERLVGTGFSVGLWGFGLAVGSSLRASTGRRCGDRFCPSCLRPRGGRNPNDCIGWSAPEVLTLQGAGSRGTGGLAG